MGDELEYKKADPIFRKQRIKEFIREDLIPTVRTNYIFIGIFVLVIIFGVVAFPYDRLLGGNMNELKISLGYPLIFFEFDLGSFDYTQPFRFLGLIVDLIIYIIISYLLDILITAIEKAYITYVNSSKTRYIPQLYKEKPEILEIK